MNKKVLAIVVPVFNEEKSLPEFWSKLSPVLNDIPGRHEVIFVNDGSTDRSQEILENFDGHSIKIIRLLVNSGHMAALDAGYRSANAKFVITMDADLQHPPSEIPLLLSIAEKNRVDVVYAIRTKRIEDSVAKRVTGELYYKILRRLSGIPIYRNAADFRLISYRVVSVIKLLPPRSHVWRLLIPKLGFTFDTHEYVAAKRVSGESKYRLKTMVHLTLTSVVSFSARPLFFAIYLGGFFSVLSLFGLTYSIMSYIFGHTISGWTSISSVISLLFGVTFLLFGILGVYLAEIWKRTSGMPDYIIESRPPMSLESDED